MSDAQSPNPTGSAQIWQTLLFGRAGSRSGQLVGQDGIPYLDNADVSNSRLARAEQTAPFASNEFTLDYNDIDTP